MKTIDDLKLSKKAKAIVKDWLQEWLDMMIRQANGQQGNVYRADFKKLDFFYFTDCTDILSKDPEAKGVEDNRSIVIRKRIVMSQLLLKNLMGTFKRLKIKCTHCGFDDVYIASLKTASGHFKWCPKCFKTDISTYPNSYDTCVDSMRKQLRKKYLGDIVEPTEATQKDLEKYGILIWKNDEDYKVISEHPLKVIVNPKLKKIENNKCGDDYC